jgi:hypothetical protein
MYFDDKGRDKSIFGKAQFIAIQRVQNAQSEQITQVCLVISALIKI